MREDLRAGGRFPDLELPDHPGNPRRLGELAAGDPLFLNFYRGFWCPKEQAFFRRLVRLQDEAEVAYTRFASVSVDPPEVAAAFRAGLDARWTFLSDAERRYLGELDLLETTDTVHRPYLSASFLLFPDLSIHQVWNGYWFWGRPTNEELRLGLRAVTRAIRPDAVHFAGAVTVEQGDGPARLADDPFARVHPARILCVGPGMFGRVASPAGPAIQRYRGKPWPVAGFDSP